MGNKESKAGEKRVEGRRVIKEIKEIKIKGGKQKSEGNGVKRKVS